MRSGIQSSLQQHGAGAEQTRTAAEGLLHQAPLLRGQVRKVEGDALGHDLRGCES